MKTCKYILAICLAVTALACNRSDEADFKVELPDGPSFDETTNEGKRMKSFFDKYGIWCEYNVPSEDLFYAWTTSENWTTSSLDYEYEEADPDYIVKALDFLEDEVMIHLPSSILDEYLGLHIALEGRIFHSCELEDYLNYTSKEDYPDLEENFEDPAYGWNGSRYLLLAPVGPEFDRTDKTTLQRGWTAVIFKEVLKKLPNPEAFEKNNQKAWDKIFGYFYNDYILGDHADDWSQGSSPYADGLVSAGAIVASSLEDNYDDEENESGYFVYISKWYGASECMDAFANYVAYIMYASAAEKAEIRAQSENVLVNEELVKAYCKQYLNWNIPELNN